MAATIRDLMEWLRQRDELSLLELLDISVEDIIERFSDKIEENYDELNEDWETEQEELQANFE